MSLDNMRKKLLIGNWKMNKTRAEAEAFARESKELTKLAKEKNVDIGVTAPFLAIEVVAKENKDLILGAQNCHYLDSGAYTGEVSVPMLLDLPISMCLVGHSERRTYYNETNESCNKKIKRLFEAKLGALYCVGETLEQFEKGISKIVVEEQVIEGLKDIEEKDLDKLVIAYEPVWSIGTGKNASKEIAEDVCAYIRSIISKLYSKESADKLRILYGGSVKPHNIHEYLTMENIDGALVGGASLSVESYKQLIENM